MFHQLHEQMMQQSLKYHNLQEAKIPTHEIPPYPLMSNAKLPDHFRQNMYYTLRHTPVPWTNYGTITHL